MKLPDLLTQSAKKYPDQIAIEDSRPFTIRYKELDAFSDQIARILMNNGIKSGDRVAICLSKSINSVASIFGILKANAAYIPLDPEAPFARNQYIVRDCAVKAIIAEKRFLSAVDPALNAQVIDEFSEYGQDIVIFVISGMSDREVPENPGTHQGFGHEAFPKQPDVSDLAYILYTSGSTGKPKGVMMSHQNALSFINWCDETFQPLPSDVFSSHAPFHFDLSILDIFLSIKSGATLILIGESEAKQPAILARLIAEKKISIWYSTPSTLNMMVNYGKMDHHHYPHLRYVFFAGEVYPINQFRRLKEIWSEPRYFNLYGPTETNVCTYYEVPPVLSPEQTEPFPIGKICPYDQGKVIDENEIEAPAGMEGELLIRGGSVMQGYWNLPERHPIAFYTDQENRLWYRTGDRVKLNPEGDYLFLGRTDRMIKKRGYRIELGEIESALSCHPEIAETAAIAYRDAENEVKIRAFLVWNGDKKPSTIQLKQFCADHLPVYMIPDAYSFCDELPKTSTHKIDFQTIKEWL